MSELTCLELSVVLWLAHILVQVGLGNLQTPFGYLFMSRDEPVKAGASYVENLTPFAAVALALMVTQRTGGAGGLGATIWILARILYLPIYVFGIIYARTLI